MLAVALGGMAGCLLRWSLALFLNRYFPYLPPGTLAANLVGCYVIGIALAVFGANPALAPEWRLLVITGFCGGLTTFSSFSAEVISLIQGGRPMWASAAVAVHVIGSLALTAAGIATVAWARG